MIYDELHLFIHPNGIIVLCAIVIIVAIIGFLIYNSNKYTVRRLLKQHRQKRIPLCKENEFVKIIGVARAMGEPLISPISKTPCVYYTVEVQRRKNGGEGSDYWRTILKDQQSQNFIIEDHEEKAIIDMQNSKRRMITSITQGIRHRSGTFNDAPKFIKDYLKSHGKKTTGLFGLNKSLRYLEGTIEIGEVIAVLGKAVRKKTDQQWDRYSLDTLFIQADQQHKLIITDDPKAIYPDI